MNDKDTVVVPGQLLALIEQARGYVADAMNGVIAAHANTPIRD